MTAPANTTEKAKHAPITTDTRWQDRKGRTWRIVENRYFGRYLCVIADRPSHSGEWTAKEIRAALARATGATP